MEARTNAGENNTFRDKENTQKNTQSILTEMDRLDSALWFDSEKFTYKFCDVKETFF